MLYKFPTISFTTMSKKCHKIKSVTWIYDKISCLEKKFIKLIKTFVNKKTNNFIFAIFTPWFKELWHAPSPNIIIDPRLFDKGWSESNYLSRDTKIFMFRRQIFFIMTCRSLDTLAIRKKVSSQIRYFRSSIFPCQWQNTHYTKC